MATQVPLSKVTTRSRPVLDVRNSVGHGSTMAKFPGLIWEHDWNSVANWVGKTCCPRDQLLSFPIIQQGHLGYWAYEHLDLSSTDLAGHHCANPRVIAVADFGFHAPYPSQQGQSTRQF